MSNVQTVSFDTLRTLAFGSISTSFVAVGTPLTHPVRLFTIINNTDGDMIFSVDGVNGQIFSPSASIKVYDLNTNRLEQQQDWILPVGTQFYVKYSTAPTQNSVYIEAFWGQ